MAQGFEERLTKLELDIKDSQKRAGKLETKVGATFEKEERYNFLVKRQGEIEEELDLTKNQAPAQVEEILSETSKESESTTVKTPLKQKRSKSIVISV